MTRKEDRLSESTPLLDSRGAFPPPETSSVRRFNSSTTSRDNKHRTSSVLLETKAPTLLGDWILSNNIDDEEGNADDAIESPSSLLSGDATSGDTNNDEQPLDFFTRLGYAFGHAQSMYMSDYITYFYICYFFYAYLVG